MAQRISRAKACISSWRTPFRLPDAASYRTQLTGALKVLYLVFSEDYAPTSGERVTRVDLTEEAIRLVRMVRRDCPQDSEAEGLLALMLLTESRHDARCGPDGLPVPLDEQDRSRWERGKMAEGIELVASALRRGRVGPYQLQAAVAAVHAEAPTADETDWLQILGLPRLLQRHDP